MVEEEESDEQLYANTAVLKWVQLQDLKAYVNRIKTEKDTLLTEYNVSKPCLYAISLYHARMQGGSEGSATRPR